MFMYKDLCENWGHNTHPWKLDKYGPKLLSICSRETYREEERYKNEKMLA